MNWRFIAAAGFPLGISTGMLLPNTLVIFGIAITASLVLAWLGTRDTWHDTSNGD